MSAKTLSIEEAKSASITLLEDAQKGKQAVHDVITAYRANRRTGSASTKTRGEVKCTNKKMYRQKGTGNARHGDRGAPIFVGGGVAFGPRPRSYNKTINKNTRKLALRRVLSDIIEAGKVSLVDSWKLEDGKTKTAISAIKAITDAKKVLVIGAEFDDPSCLAARNLKTVVMMSADEVNIEQMLHANHIIITKDALAIIAKRSA